MVSDRIVGHLIALVEVGVVFAEGVRPPGGRYAVADGHPAPTGCRRVRGRAPARAVMIGGITVKLAGRGCS